MLASMALRLVFLYACVAGFACAIMLWLLASLTLGSVFFVGCGDFVLTFGAVRVLLG